MFKHWGRDFCSGRVQWLSVTPSYKLSFVRADLTPQLWLDIPLRNQDCRTLLSWFEALSLHPRGFHSETLVLRSSKDTRALFSVGCLNIEHQDRFGQNSLNTVFSKGHQELIPKNES